MKSRRLKSSLDDWVQFPGWVYEGKVNEWVKSEMLEASLPNLHFHDPVQQSLL
jgi:hypothetical protein